MSTSTLDVKSYYNVRAYGRKRQLHEALALHAKKSKLDDRLETISVLCNAAAYTFLPFILVHLYFRYDRFTMSMAVVLGIAVGICAVAFLIVELRGRQQFYAYDRIRGVLSRYLHDVYGISPAEGVWDKIMVGDRDDLFCKHQDGYASATLDCSSDRVVLRGKDGNELPKVEATS